MEVGITEVEHGEVFGTGFEIVSKVAGGVDLRSPVLSAVPRSNVDEQSCGTTAATSDASADDVTYSHCERYLVIVCVSASPLDGPVIEFGVSSGPKTKVYVHGRRWESVWICMWNLSE
ncbi:hypothetical protein QA089_002936 [Meyerozyma guilliermondii]